jgi:hypothetical protein
MFVLAANRGQRVRIEPIRDVCEAQHLRALSHAEFYASRATVREDRPRTSLVDLTNRDVEHMLFNRALAGVLTRLRTLDWQVLHSHLPKHAGIRGANLDVLA